MKTVETADIIDAFVAKMEGRTDDECRNLVNCNTRLFPHAIRIAGWSHLFGNIVKAVANSHPEWPKVLTAMRELTSFVKLGSWRLHLQGMLKGREDLDVSTLDSFTASFAKWRCETMCEVLVRQLVKVRVIAERGGIIVSALSR